MKTVYVLEKYYRINDYKAILHDVEASLDKLPRELQITKSKAIDVIIDSLKDKIHGCVMNGGGMWEGVIGRRTLDDLNEAAYIEWCEDKESAYRVVEAQIPDNANTWAGYVGRKLLKGVTTDMLSKFRTRVDFTAL